MDDDIKMGEIIDEDEFILNHVVLPRFLPPKEQNFSIQLKIVDHMVKNVVESRSFLPMNTIQLCKKFSRIHVESTDDTLNQSIGKELKSLQVSDTFAMFVRQQNCTFMVHKKQQSLILATFDSDVNPREVYNHDSDIEVNSFIHSFMLFLEDKLNKTLS